MSHVETLPAPTLDKPPVDKWRREQQAFRRLLTDLLVKLRGQYVAINDGKVVESGTDKLTVAERAYAAYGHVPIFVSLVTDEPLPVIRIPSPKVMTAEKRS
jgi:hypothetical protein